MPTAIVRTYTTDGFVIAADGRSCNGTTGASTEEYMQKIFQVGREPLACSFTGAAKLGAADSDDASIVLFNFVSKFHESVQVVSARRFTTLQKYAAKLSSVIYRDLKDTIQRGNVELPDIASLDLPEQGRTIVDIYIDGYYGGFPSRVRIRFWHQNRQLREPDVTNEALMPMISILHGIPEIGRRLTHGDPALAHYLQPIDFGVDKGLDILSALVLSKGFIEACAGPEGMEIDPLVSATINRNAHMATITAAQGFEWVAAIENVWKPEAMAP